LKDFKKTVADYLAWEVSNLLKNKGEDDCLGKEKPHLEKC
jgi:putative S of type II restriction endonuclease, N6_Mtase domain protein